MQRHSAQVDGFAYRVARRARDFGDDRPLGAGQSIQQARFADVGLARQDNLYAFAQQPALPRCRDNLRQLLAHTLKLGTRVPALEHFHVFFRKIEGSFDQHAQFGQGVHHRADLMGELPLQRTHCAARCLRGGRINQIGDAFRLCEIELIVEKCAFSEFAGFGNPRTEFETALQHHLQHDRPAVSLQLDDVFPRVGMRRGEIKRQALIDYAAIGVKKVGAGRVARLQLLRDQHVQHTRKVGTRDAHDPNAAPTWGRSYSGYNIICHAPAWGAPWRA